MHWFNEDRLRSSIVYLAPVEMENQYYREDYPQQQPPLGQPTLHQTRGRFMGRCAQGHKMPALKQ